MNRTLRTRQNGRGFNQLLTAVGILAMGTASMPGTADAEYDGETLRVGIVAFYTGPAAGPFGIPARNAAELVIEAINEGVLPEPYDTAGVGGMTIEPVYVDEAGGTTQQVTEYRNMVQRQDVDAVVGYISSGSCIAVAPVAEELETITFLFDCGTPRIFEDASYDYVFRAMSTATMDNVAAALYLADKFPELESFQGIQQNYAWGQDSWRDFEATMAQVLSDAENRDTLMTTLGSGQYGAEVSRLSISRPDVIHSSMWGGDLESFLLQSIPRGLGETSTMTLTAGETVLHRLGGQLPDGTVIGGRGPYGALARESDLNSWFVENFTERFGEPPVYSAYHMAQGVLALKVAFDKAAEEHGTVETPEQVSEAFAGTEFESFSTTVKMALGDGHQAITETAYGMTQWNEEEGRTELVDVIYYPAECVNPPAGQNSIDWIEAGMPGAKCD